MNDAVCDATGDADTTKAGSQINQASLNKRLSGMLKNYFIVALRNLKHNKSYTLLNVLGLAVGIASCLLIFLVMQFETNFDTYHKQKDNIYRIGTEFHDDDGISYSAGTAFPVIPALQADFPQIKQCARIFRYSDQQITLDETKPAKKFNEAEFYFAEPGFFSIFDFTFLSGNASSLAEPNTMLLSQSVAEKYFDSWKNAVGKTVKWNNKYLFKIAGIIKDAPANSDFPLEVLASFATLKNTGFAQNLEDWVSTFGQNYSFVVLPSEISAAKFNADLKAFTKKHKPADYAKDLLVSQPLTDIHFNSDFGNFKNRTFSHNLINALMLIGIFLIVIACVNFINLATAQAVNRAKEVGVRKVLGSNRKQLTWQFLSETAIITFSAVILAAAIAVVALPFINQLLDIKISFALKPAIILFLLSAGVAVTFLSGLYPAIILSGFNPITALKSKITQKMAGGISLRRGLVIAQFAVAHILIIGTFIVVSQTDYFRNASLGFDKDAILNVPIQSDSIGRSKLTYLRNQLLQNQNVQGVSFSFASPADYSGWNSDFKFDHAVKSTNFNASLKWADADYFKTYQLQFVAGRPYYVSDSIREFVVNETLLKKLGITDAKNAIGKQIDFWDGEKVANIVGVVKDFNSNSLREPMAPVLLSTWNDVYNIANIKIKAGKEKQSLSDIEKIWSAVYPDIVYQYQFLNEKIDSFYRQENQLAQLYKLFAGIAIFISCLGLYGLVSFMAAQRTKEMGIRKVLGASAANIVYLLSKEFTLLIIIAFVIAAPVAWYIMHNWLQNFAYRIPLSISIFIAAIASSVIIAWITVEYRAIKAALANPVKLLRTE